MEFDLHTYLKPWIGKIVVSDTVYTKKEERKLYDGTITNENVREMFPNGVLFEFDHNTENYDECRIEAEKWTQKIEELCKSKNKYYLKKGHKGGKSPHMNMHIEGLENIPPNQRKFIRRQFTDAILQEIKFESKLIRLDESFITDEFRWVPLETMPHWKPQYKGAIEEVICINEGDYFSIPNEIINSHFKSTDTDNSLIGKALNLCGIGFAKVIQCPFHNDHNPSMNIWNNKAHCFVCNRIWNPIEFLIAKKKIGKYEARKLLGLANDTADIPNNSKLDPVFIVDIATIDDKKETCYKIAVELIDCYSIKRYNGSENFYYYEDGIYKANGKTQIENEIGYILGEKATNHITNEILGHAKRLCGKTDLSEPDKLICLKNGILNIETSELTEYSSEHFFLNKLPVAFDKNADCPKIKKFLNEVLLPEDITKMQEMIGYLLYKRHHIHRSFIFNGVGSNGKSTLLNLLKNFLGPHNCCNISLQQIETDKFAVIALQGKLLNFFADMSDKALASTSNFKSLTGEDTLFVQKKYEDGKNFTSYAKMLFSCNRIPRTPDDSDAFYRRWVIINFNNVISEEKANKNLALELSTPEELSGLLNYAIAGLNRLLANGVFSGMRSIEETRRQYTKLSDSIQSYCDDLLEPDFDNVIAKQELYIKYIDYCKQNKQPIENESVFHKRLQKIMNIVEIRPQRGDNKGRCFKGVKYNLDFQFNAEKPKDKLASYISTTNGQLITKEPEQVINTTSFINPLTAVKEESVKSILPERKPEEFVPKQALPIEKCNCCQITDWQEDWWGWRFCKPCFELAHWGNCNGLKMLDTIQRLAEKPISEEFLAQYIFKVYKFTEEQSEKYIEVMKTKGIIFTPKPGIVQVLK